MKVQIVTISLGLLFVALTSVEAGILNSNTCDRITQHGYPCQNYTVTTSDGYLLTLFRIPHAHGEIESAKEDIVRPPVLMMHCLLCSSDIFVLNGPDDGLPFMLADVGYDVWFGNARGNTYSQRHISLSPTSEAFWTFSLHEIALIDVPTTIDYILEATNEPRLHYISYSQGSTVFMILQSAKPEYGRKIRTSHLMAPTVFMRHIRVPLFWLLAQLLGQSGAAANFIGTFPSQDLMGMVRVLSRRVCMAPQTQTLCIQILNIIGGWDSPYLNRTLLPELLLTTPADGSNLQLNQYLQFAMTGEFKAYDFGKEKNILQYGQPQPPAYDLRNVRTEVPIEFYFADNDYLATWQDIKHLRNVIGKQGNWNRIKLKKFNHFDFTLGLNVKQCLNDCILDRMEKNEGRAFNGSLCKYFRNKAF
ncbi:lipase 3-like [Musca autumnalis]|uniref:lipase 3-like n=1 Tax=Musca autumnalis TaxID=221902 RepID=UPI003CE87718